MRHVLVAVDETEASERVTAFVNGFFEGLDVAVTGVNVGRAPLAWAGYPATPGLVYEWPYTAATPSAAIDGTGEVSTDEMREAAEHTVASSGLDATDKVVDLGADVADTLRRLASERGVDLIVVGSSHKGALERLFSPSVSSDLAKSAPTPVLVVH